MWPGADADAKLRVYADYIKHAMSAAGGLPNFVGKVYRGMDAHVKKSAYAAGKVITWQPFSSSSRSQIAACAAPNSPFEQHISLLTCPLDSPRRAAQPAAHVRSQSAFDGTHPLPLTPLSRPHPARSRRGFVETLPGVKLSGSMFVIESICAKKIEDFSAIPAEQEVLFLPNAQFKVVGRLETQEEKEDALDDLDAYDMESLHVYVLKQLA